MTIEKNKLRDKIKEVEFSLKELYRFKKKIKDGNPKHRVSANELHDIIYSSAKRALRDYVIVFMTMLFFHIPFIVKGVLDRKFDFLFITLDVMFFLYLVVYISGKLRNMPLCAQHKLIRLAIKLIFTIRL